MINWHSFALLSARQSFAITLLQMYTFTHTGDNEQIKRGGEREKEKDGMRVGVNEDVLNGWLHSRSVTVVMWDAFMIDSPLLPCSEI